MGLVVDSVIGGCVGICRLVWPVPIRFVNNGIHDGSNFTVMAKLGEPKCTTFKEGTLEGALGGSDMFLTQLLQSNPQFVC